MTIKDKMPLIHQYSGTIFVPEFVEDLLNSFDTLLPALARMDNKDKTDQTPGSQEDDVSLLKNLDQNTDLVEAILDGFNAARPLMMLTTQVLAIQTLIQNLGEFAEKVNWVPRSLGFRENPNSRGMCSYILDSITKKTRVIPRFISVWDEDQDDDEDGSERGPRGRHHAQGGSRGQQSGPTCAQRQHQEDNRESSLTTTGCRQTQLRPQQRRTARKTSPRPPSQVESDSDSDSDSSNQVYTQKDPLRQHVPAPPPLLQRAAAAQKRRRAPRQ